MNRKGTDPGVTVTDPGNASADPVTGPVTGRVTPSPETLAVTGNTAASAAVVPVTIPERAGAVARRAGNAAAEAARELWLHPDRLVHVIVHGKAETMAAHRAYVKSRAWVPAGMSEAAGKAVIIAGLAHYLIAARPLKAAMKAVKFAAEKVEQAADRAVSFYIVAAIAVALIVLL